MSEKLDTIRGGKGQVETLRAGRRRWLWRAYAPPYAYLCAKGVARSERAALRAGRRALEAWATKRVHNV